jgi:hypothetical protein
LSAAFVELLIETKAGSEEEAFSCLEHNGRRTERFYVVKRLRHEARLTRPMAGRSRPSREPQHAVQ